MKYRNGIFLFDIDCLQHYCLVRSRQFPVLKVLKQYISSRMLQRERRGKVAVVTLVANSCRRFTLASKESTMIRQIQFLSCAVLVALAVNSMCLVGGMAFGQSAPTWLRCGNPDGSTNALCPQCIGTCKMNFAVGGGRQSYKICQDTGTGCTMPANKNAFCSGLLYDGGADGKGGCVGTSYGTCQYDIKKCPA
jgi:hypothetical protein